MARLSCMNSRQPSPAHSADSDLSDCPDPFSSADTGSKASTSTRPTSVSSKASSEAPLSSSRTRANRARSATKTRPASSGKRTSDVESGATKTQTKSTTLMGFGFTKGRPVLSHGDPLTPAESATSQEAARSVSLISEQSLGDESTRHVSSSSRTPLLEPDVPAVPPRSPKRRSAAFITNTGADSSGAIQAPKRQHLQAQEQDQRSEPHRDLSGATLVPTQTDKTADRRDELKTAKEKDSEDHVDSLDEGWGARHAFEDEREQHQLEQKPKTGIISKLKEKIQSVAQSIGKRKRDVTEVLDRGKEKLQRQGSRKSTRFDIEEDDEDIDDSQPPAKKLKSAMSRSSTTLTTTQPPSRNPRKKTRKAWLRQGLYVGQQRDFNARLTSAQNKRKRESASEATQTAENKSLPLPMFYGEDTLKNGRDFKLPFDIFNPLPPGQPKPDEWKKTASNKVIGDAVHIVNEWRKFNKLPASHCFCTAEDGCDEDCLNRNMFYECDEKNCKLTVEQCGNRAFAELKERVERERTEKEISKEGKKYGIGVEVVKTAGKGFGVRASRTFEPGQIITEYAGEIITTDECVDRMNDRYKDAACYYLMTFDGNLIIDATRGTIARFINHSCEPNSEMIKWTVAGKPRMALFAGPGGISTGEELTYDYNFDNFNSASLTDCMCGADLCRGFLGKKPTAEDVKRARSDKERAELERLKEMAENAERQKSKKKKRAKGWAYIDADGNEVDPDEEVRKPAKRAKITGTVTEKVMGKDGEAVVGRSRSVLRKKKLVGKA